MWVDKRGSEVGDAGDKQKREFKGVDEEFGGGEQPGMDGKLRVGWLIGGIGK